MVSQFSCLRNMCCLELSTRGAGSGEGEECYMTGHFCLQALQILLTQTSLKNLYNYFYFIFNASHLIAFYLRDKLDCFTLNPKSVYTALSWEFNLHMPAFSVPPYCHASLGALIFTICEMKHLLGCFHRIPELLC